MTNKRYILMFAMLTTLLSCNKFLDKKGRSSQSLITSTTDALALLDNVSVNNATPLPYFGESSADNFYLTEDALNSLSYYPGNLQTYIWGRHPFEGADEGGATAWGNAYNGVFLMNNILDALNKIAVNAINKTDYYNARGCALAFRSWYFWKLAVTFSKSYNEATAETDLGIPLRLTSDFNDKSVRPSVKDTYAKILEDMQAALPMLPDRPQYVTRPGKQSVYAMLADVYLSMREYNKAGLYADSSLRINHDLLDFNTVNPSDPYPLSPFSNEITFYLEAYTDPLGAPTIGHIDTMLYASYADNDLRKQVFFQENPDTTYIFKGTFGLDGTTFVGLTNSEMYFVRAESEARAGNAGKAMDDLNAVMQNRMINTPSQPFVPFTASSAQDALEKVLTERRKELIFRDSRWMDIKRLNLEGANIILKRIVEGQTYTLAPNDNRYAIPLPESVIKISGMPQNP